MSAKQRSKPKHSFQHEGSDARCPVCGGHHSAITRPGRFMPCYPGANDERSMGQRPAAGPWIAVTERMPDIVPELGRSYYVLAWSSGVVLAWWDGSGWTEAYSGERTTSEDINVTHYAEIRRPE